MIFVTVIPARGGSKRLPGKNIKPLNGKPLLAYSIEYSLKESRIAHTFVSSDSADIMSIAKDYGATPLSRPRELSGDHVSTAAVLTEAAEQIKSYGIDFDYMVLLQPTNPLRPSKLLAEAIDIIDSLDYDGVMSVTRCDKKLGKIIENQFVPWSYKFGQRSQDIEPLYYENGLLYIASKQQILKGNILTENTYPLVVDHIYATVDIDTIEDFNYAEYIFNTYKDE